MTKKSLFSLPLVAVFLFLFAAIPAECLVAEQEGDNVVYDPSLSWGSRHRGVRLR
jgi:hypothetical protein